MKYELTDNEIRTYRENGFVIIKDFLSPEELKEWREAVGEAVLERNGVNSRPGRQNRGRRWHQ